MKHSQWIVLLLALLLLLPACAAPDVSNPAGSSAPATTSPVTEAPPAVPIYRGEPLTYTAGERDETVDGGIRLSDLTAADGKKLYRITTLAAAPAEADWATVPAVCVDTYQWRDNGYEPAVFAQVVFVPEDGFYARLVCREADPYYTATEYLGSVWNDSCLEFFADWGNSGSYTNVEVNAYGASYQGFGISMKERSVFPTPRVGVSSLVREEEWEVRLSVPLTLLEELYPGLTISPGYTFTGNFYKCGSKCEFPHYGMWNPIDSPSANFHLPAFFGYLTVS